MLLLFCFVFVFFGHWSFLLFLFCPCLFLFLPPSWTYASIQCSIRSISPLSLSLSIYIYIYVCVSVCVCIYIYILNIAGHCAPNQIYIRQASASEFVGSLPFWLRFNLFTLKTCGESKVYFFIFSFFLFCMLLLWYKICLALLSQQLFIRRRTIFFYQWNLFRLRMYLPNPSSRVDSTRGKFLMQNLWVEFKCFLLDRLPYQDKRVQSARIFFAIAEGRIVGFLPFSRELAQCEMQTALSRIWTRVTVSILNDENQTYMRTHFHTRVLLSSSGPTKC